MNAKNKPTAISLFSGAGGMDIGVKQAGFEVLACIEVDPYACETLRANISLKREKTKVFEGDIRKIDCEELKNDLGIKKGELGLLCGGPPCQSFSQIGKQKSLSDERGLLLFEMVRFAKAFQPKAVMIENVKGLLNAKDENGKVGGAFEKLIQELESLNYVPKWKIIDSADYGVPQHRQRVFIVATKKPNGFSFPEPIHGSIKNSNSLFALPPYVTVGSVIKGLGKPYKLNGYIPENGHLDVTPAGDIRRITGVPEGEHLSGQLHLPEKQRGKLSKKDTTKFKRLSRTKPSNTLRCGEIFFHPQEDRYLTPREYMRIHCFPDDYFLRGPIRGRSGSARFLDQHRQVANSVPPPVAKYLALSIKEVLIKELIYA